MWQKSSRKVVVRAEKGFTLFILNEDMNDIIKTIKWLADLGVLIDGVWNKKQEGGFLGALVAPLVQSLISLVVKGISEIRVRRAGSSYIDKNFLIVLHPLSNIEITK